MYTDAFCEGTACKSAINCRGVGELSDALYGAVGVLVSAAGVFRFMTSVSVMEIPRKSPELIDMFGWDWTGQAIASEDDMFVVLFGQSD